MGRNKSRYIDKADKKKLKDKSTVLSTTGHDIGRGTILKDSSSYISGSDKSNRHGNMILKSDGDDLKKMVKLFDEGKLKVCVDEHFGFDKVPDALSKSLTARSGGKLVIDVASPAPSETCCVVA